jgi:hypothetical protein
VGCFLDYSIVITKTTDCITLHFIYSADDFSEKASQSEKYTPSVKSPFIGIEGDIMNV